MPGDALQNARQCLRPDRVVQGDDFVVFTTILRRDSHVRAPLSCRFVSPVVEVPPAAWCHSRRGATSCHEDLVTHEVQADQPGPGHGLVEVAVNSLLDVAADVFE